MGLKKFRSKAGIKSLTKILQLALIAYLKYEQFIYYFIVFEKWHAVDGQIEPAVNVSDSMKAISYAVFDEAPCFSSSRRQNSASCC